MGTRERDTTTLKSGDSGYGDVPEAVDLAAAADVAGDGSSVNTSRSDSQSHPLTQKGYEVGPASKLQIGDVFEFLWADADEFHWEWRCLGYSRFIVLRHSETFPHHVICVPISVGTKHDFAKPGIDSFQQGHVFHHGEQDPDKGPRLQYSAVGIELRPGKFRVKENSRANYADIVDIDHEAQVLTIGDVARYFDRVRRNANRAIMRQTLRKALEEYKARRKSKGLYGMNGSIRGSTIDVANATIQPTAINRDDDEAGLEDVGEEEEEERYTFRRHPEQPSVDEAVQDDEDDQGSSRRSTRPSSLRKLSRSSRSSQQGQGLSRRPRNDPDYDLQSMQNVAMAGLK